MAVRQLTVDRVLGWRAGRHLLGRPAGVDVIAVGGPPRRGRRAPRLGLAGWISPVVVHRSRVVGTWDARDGEPVVRLWPEAPPVPTDRLDAEVTRCGRT
ncbi:hypothetical protein EV384_1550 [Micromonospora kangleipakensis]|uniref:Uncharacterized protein n=1 Tax=Micromonospora kangleipakensis TaxID=1077942 RepID=A0A4Q8B7Q1_9ACTN|nr:hypothetical protein [Micromonospora kangleipakensis]RZU73151.1 hypothetical protein EV384_1550 [Micromonospora kangleipakensis]